MRRSPSNDPEVQKNRRRETNKAWAKANPEKKREYARRHRAKYRERYNQKMRSWIAKNPSYVKRMKIGHNLKANYGMSLEEYDAMFVAQHGVCAVCASVPGKKRLSVDHNHTTGAIRALLCDRCNRGIGYFKENPVTMIKAIEYLRRFG